MSTVPPSSALNPETLDALSRDLGRDTVAMIVQTFLQELGARLGEIASGDPERVRRAAHPLKSGAALVGADELSRVAAIAEAGGDNQPDVEQAARGAEQALHHWLADS